MEIMRTLESSAVSEPGQRSLAESNLPTTAFIDNFAKVVRRSRLCKWWQMRGMRKAEIWEIEKHFEVLLPEIYIDFLAKMGGGAGEFFAGFAIFRNDLFKIRKEFRRVLKRDGDPFDLPSETFVFASHRGNVFFFFDTSDYHKDPPIYGYTRNDRHIRLVSESFSGFLIESLAGQKAFGTKFTIRKNAVSRLQHQLD